MGHTKQTTRWAISACLGLVAGILMAGCASTPTGGGGNDEEYNLVVVLEKNLDSGQDVIYVKFLKDGAGIDDAVVVVDGDTISTSSVSGKGNKTYTTARWQHGEKVQIAAVDVVGSFVYRDSVVVPDEFGIETVVPTTRIVRPSDGNAQVSWTGSIGAVNYLISLDNRNSSLSPAPLGFVGYSESQSGLSQVILPTAFRDTFGNFIEDVYDIKLIAYSPNFIFRDNAPYNRPPNDDVRTPIINDNVTGAVAALVVSDRDTLVADTQ